MTTTIHEREAQCARIYEAWHECAKNRDTEGLLALYADDAVLETPLIPVILDDVEGGMLRGHAALRRFFTEGARRRPNDLVRWHRTGTYLCDGHTLFWEYPRAMPDGEQVDIAEVMEIEDGLIARHRIYWGWFGFALLQRSRDAKRARVMESTMIGKEKTMVSTTIQPQWLAHLDESHARTLTQVHAGNVDPAALRSVADLEAFFALNLAPMPVDPVAHIRVGYAKTRTYLEQLPRHDPSGIVSISARDGYVYPMTPRKVLRRVLDHLLDHLNQIDQWIAWQDDGIVPVPTDGWAPSAVTLDDDTLPLTEADLSAWLWRIDLIVGLLTTRASQLPPTQLDWQPPDGGWNLRRVIHHVARTYGYAAWLDEALPEDGESRYIEANRRLRDRFARLIAEPPPPDTAFYMAEGRQFTPAEAMRETLEAEEQVQTAGVLAPATSAGGV